jgi:hypothetical protein
VKIKTQDLTGAALDWAVAVAEGRDYAVDMPQEIGGLLYYAENGEMHRYSPSTNWNLMGPIIEQNAISLDPAVYPQHPDGWWKAVCVTIDEDDLGMCYGGEGPTPLIAAARCLVASKLGDEVDIPEELL